ncbi:MAG: RHS repeat protein [Kiritimatiellae bacterium]|nr:RHS repeat protein [Kiritimatiellia bacterium]
MRARGAAALLLALTAGAAWLPARTALGQVGRNNTYCSTLLAGDPVATGGGTYRFRIPLLRLGGPMQLDFGLIYRSELAALNNTAPSDLPGRFWWTPKLEALKTPWYWGNPMFSVFTVQLPDGDFVAFIDEWPSTTWRLLQPGEAPYTDNAMGTPYELKQTASYFYLKDPARGRVYMFQRNIDGNGKARVRAILDRNHNRLLYEYAAPTDTAPTSIADEFGRSLSFNYGLAGSQTCLLSVTSHCGRAVHFMHEEQGADNSDAWTLRGFTNAAGEATTFVYQSNELNKIQQRVWPRGNAPWTQAYGERNLNGVTTVRVVSQQDALGHTFAYSYSETSSVVTVEQPDLTAWQYEHYSVESLPKSVTDPAGVRATFAKDGYERLVSATDRLGRTTLFGYDGTSGRLAAITNAQNHALRFAYSAVSQAFTNPVMPSDSVFFTFHDMTRIDYPEGSTEFFAYDTCGNLTNYTDRAGDAWAFTHDGSGRVLTIRNPAGGVVSNAYNAAGLRTSSLDSETAATQYEYDALNRLIRKTDGLGNVTSYDYDDMDRLLSVVDPLSNTVTLAYDANGNLTQFADPASNAFCYVYDEMDRIVQVTNRLGLATAYAYDALGRLSRVTWPDGDWQDYTYEPCGRLAGISDAQSNQWSLSHDEAGLITGVQDPMGRVWSFSADALGQLASAADPLGRSTAFGRDVMSRITNMTDNLFRTVQLGYDSRGARTNLTDRTTGTAFISYTPLGLPETVTDLNGQPWTIGYTPEGRLASLTDPLTGNWQYGYDPLGRLITIAYPDGTVQTNTYDARGNVTNVVCDAEPTGYSYDPLNRLVGSSSIALDYDAEGRITNSLAAGVAFGAEYDPAGRLQCARYDGGTLAVSYAYDSLGRLAGVADDLTGHGVAFSYDPAGRLTGIARTNGVATTLSYDDSGLLSRIQAGGFLDLEYTLDAAGQVGGVRITAPLDPADLLAGETNTFTFGNASELTAAGYAYDARGRMTNSPSGSYAWDGFGRLRAAGSATFEYDGLGRLIRRVDGGQTNAFLRHAAIGGAPVAAERDENAGQVQRYYVYTPDGRLVYMIDAAAGNAVSYFHFDRTGSTLALTDGGGSVQDAYAYAPYGQRLQHTGANPQPFTFGGQYGVRQEDADGRLYQMGARYYDALSAQFLSREPVWPQMWNAKNINPYQYAWQNPASYTDPSGAYVSMMGVAVQFAIIANLSNLLLPSYLDAVREAKLDRIHSDAATIARQMAVWIATRPEAETPRAGEGGGDSRQTAAQADLARKRADIAQAAGGGGGSGGCGALPARNEAIRARTDGAFRAEFGPLTRGQMDRHVGLSDFTLKTLAKICEMGHAPGARTADLLGPSAVLPAPGQTPAELARWLHTGTAPSPATSGAGAPFRLFECMPITYEPPAIRAQDGHANLYEKIEIRAFRIDME